jgi:hypothetical protein
MQQSLSPHDYCRSIAVPQDGDANVATTREHDSSDATPRAHRDRSPSADCASVEIHGGSSQGHAPTAN